MVRADEEDAVHLLDRIDCGADALVNALNCFDGSFEHTCVADHIGVGEVDDDDVVLAGSDGCVQLLADFGSAHLGLQVIGSDCRRRNQGPVLILVGFLDTAVEEEGDMGVLLGLGNPELLEAVLGKIFAQGIFDLFLLEGDELVRNRLVIVLEADICKGHVAVFAL